MAEDSVAPPWKVRKISDRNKIIVTSVPLVSFFQIFSTSRLIKIKQ